MSYRALQAHGVDRSGDFYLSALRYAHHLWLDGYAGRALLALTRALYADIQVDDPVLLRHPLPYAALRWIVATHGSDDFPGNPRISYQHQALRLRGSRSAIRKARAWAAWAIVRKTRPSLPGDPAITAPEPDIEPAAMGPSKSRGTSSISQLNDSPVFNLPVKRSPARQTLAEDPPGMTACRLRPSRRPPPIL